MSDSCEESLQSLFSFFQNAAATHVDKYQSGVEKLSLPVIPVPLVLDICQQALELFRTEESLLTISSPVVIVGDVHGHMIDLLRIFHELGFPPARNYLFLGDFVDRGEFSSECVILILLLKVLFPRHVWLIRGNHEFSDLWMHCGFAAELGRNFQGRGVVEAFSTVFSYMPLGAVLFDSILCVHGGIGPALTCREQIKQIPRPVLSYESEPIASLMWSDPSNEVEYFKMSSRGLGFLFGKKALHTFLENEQLDLLVRGHVCVDGVQWDFGDKLVTVFSASNYCGVSNNRSGVLIVNGKGEYEPKLFVPLRYTRRYSVRFVDIRGPGQPSEIPNSHTMPNLQRTHLVSSQSLSTIGGVPVRHLAKVSVAQGKCECNGSSTSMRVKIPRAIPRPAMPHRGSHDRGQYISYEALSDSSSTEPVITPANGFKKFRQSMIARDVRPTPASLGAETSRPFRFQGFP